MAHSAECPSSLQRIFKQSLLPFAILFSVGVYLIGGPEDDSGSRPRFPATVPAEFNKPVALDRDAGYVVLRGDLKRSDTLSCRRPARFPPPPIARRFVCFPLPPTLPRPGLIVLQGQRINRICVARGSHCRMHYNRYACLCLVAIVLGQATSLPQHRQGNQQLEQRAREHRKFAEKSNAVKKVAIDEAGDLNSNAIQVRHREGTRLYRRGVLRQ